VTEQHMPKGTSQSGGPSESSKTRFAEGLLLNEHFSTMQGEGSHTGKPSTFFRLQGCAVGCPWCDTKYTWKVNAANLVHYVALANKAPGSPEFAIVEAAFLVRLAKEYGNNHVVFTGGEPCVYDLFKVTNDLESLGFTTQIETSGTHEISADPGTFVTLSPKVDMPGGLVVLDDALLRADEIKMPVGKPADITTLQKLLARRLEVRKSATAYHVPVYLQPLSMSKKATELCLEAARVNDWLVSVQTHKVAGLR